MVNVVKSSGEIQKFDAEKINKVLDFAAIGLDVSPSEIAMKAKIQIYDGITTNEIHDMLIKSSADLISEEEPDYQYCSSRLLLFKLRREAYKSYFPCSFLQHIQNLVNLGWYDEHILKDYSQEDIKYLDNFINHDYDLNYTYIAMQQFKDKYLIKNRINGQLFETPQMALMLISMCLHTKEKENRLQKVIEFYEALAKMEISLPTPIMAGLRTPTRQFSSCVLIESGDNIDQIFNASTAQGKYTAKRAGIGLNVGGIRGKGAAIRNGEVSHAGLVPIIKMYQESLGWASQGGIRKGSATYFYPIWHMDFESLVVLKNNRGTEETRARHVDYGIQLSKLFYQRLLEDKNITFFHPNVENGKLYQLFYSNQEEFEKLYISLENDSGILKKSLPAKEVFRMIATERSQTGRIYIQNIDHCNTHSAFNSEISPVKQSNLCVVPETKILTSEGYKIIKDLENSEIKVWNGEEFTETKIYKTGTNQNIIKVITDSGYEIECTPYHKFYIQKGYTKGSGKDKFEIIEKEAKNLVNGDKLIKFNLPLIEGSKTLNLAYENGFYSGDGCDIKNTNENRVYLYNEKRKLLKYFRGNPTIHHDKKYMRIALRYYGLCPKFFVPDSTYTISSRLEWLAGFADADGTVLRNETSESVCLSNSNKNFLKDIQLMLQTLGVESKVKDAIEEGYQNLPLNNGSGKYGKFLCKKTYRLTINTFEMNKLIKLGLQFNRLTFKSSTPNRNASQFTKIRTVIDEGRVSDTYCFTEYKRNMGMFNGILTGQCMEITLPTTPINNINSTDGEIALCTLLALNLGKLNDKKDLERLTQISVRALDNLLDYQDYPVKAAEKTKNRRSLGIGWTNLAYYLAKKGLNYSSGNANNEIHELAEAFQYYLLKASNDLAKEKGACYDFNCTSYAQGILPIDRYKKTIDKYHTTSLKMDWELLRDNIKKYGLRNSTLSAMMPCETSSQITNSTNGIEPPRAALSFKSSGDGSFRQLVPEVNTMRNSYEYKWEMNSPRGYLTICGLIQKFIDQSISTNTFYKPWDYAQGKLPLQVVLDDILHAYSIGLKTLYYHEVKDNEEIDDCEACKI